MTGVMMNYSIPYDPFSTSYLIKDQQNLDLSPVALYNPLEDFDPDFAAESATSPEIESPVSPASFPLPTTTGHDWPSPSNALSSPDIFKTESFDSAALTPPTVSQSLSASPAINPMELSTSPLSDDVPFGGSEGLIADYGSLFPSPRLARAQNPAQVNHCAPNASLDSLKSEDNVNVGPPQRPATKGMKRKSKRLSISSPSSSPRSSASPPPAAPRGGNPAAAAGKTSSDHVSLPPKRTAHNMIEKRYRTNLNDKISALRDAVPALRVMVHRLEARGAGSDDEGAAAADGINGRRITAQDFGEDLGGLTPAHKLNKATILSKATEYIAHLERKNQALAGENQGLRSKVVGLEMLITNGAARGVWC